MTEVKRYPISRIEMKLKDLYEMYKSGTLILNPEFQRSYIWERMRGKRERLIDSLLREFDIGTIYLRRVEKIVDGKPIVTYECLDGQQRLKSIFDFIDGEFAISPKITWEFKEPKKFDELEPKYQLKITDVWIKPIVVETNDEDIVSDVFMRLQEGVPLKSAEKLNAIKGEMKKAVIKLSKHPFLQETEISKYRFNRRYLCAQLVYLEKERKEPDSSWNFKVKYKQLKKMFEEYAGYDKKASIEKLINKVRSNFNFLNQVLGKSASIIRYNGDMISIYLFASYLKNRYAIKGKKNELKIFIRNFFSKVESARKEESSIFGRFKMNRRRATTDGEVMRENMELLLTEFLKYVPDLELKDDKRLFDWGQKLAIYSLQDGKCKACGKEISIKDAQFHHRVPWELGGKTTVENGEMYCIKHHPR